ncbi:NUDIX domain-containing protein [Nonomuraea sp. B5E05]|uniref:NUDIX hydrolase n=1 Tax=Nonomuraea sp. B5E05 TaxID=3153569 RepID=UPI003260F912
MSISQAEIRATIRRYLDIYPEESGNLQVLIRSVENRPNLWSRKTYPMHITCSAAVVDDLGQVLVIHNLALDRWLLPGGHIEPSDFNLVAACLRELREESSINSQLAVSPSGLDTTPIDIDIHEIPANPKKSEPEHMHADFRYVFRTLYQRVEVQDEEIGAYAWRRPRDLHTLRLVQKITELADQPFAV